MRQNVSSITTAGKVEPNLNDFIFFYIVDFGGK